MITTMLMSRTILYPPPRRSTSREELRGKRPPRLWLCYSSWKMLVVGILVVRVFLSSLPSSSFLSYSYTSTTTNRPTTSAIKNGLALSSYNAFLVPSSSISTNTSIRSRRSVVYNFNSTAKPIDDHHDNRSTNAFPASTSLPNISSSSNPLTTISSNNHDDGGDENAEMEQELSTSSQLTYFETLAGNIVNCLIKSDLKRKGGGDGGGSTGWTSWVDDASCFQLKCCIDKLSLNLPEIPLDMGSEDIGDQLQSRDEAMARMRWLKASPAPLMIELSHELQNTANQYIFDDDLVNIETTREEFLERMGLRLITIPSGKPLNQLIRTPAGAMAFGKLLWGGAKRYRILPGKFQRKAGEREALKTNIDENIDCWLQYGGPERIYQSIDMGPCAILEIIILPKGLRFVHGLEGNELDGHMTMTQLSWDPNTMFDFYQEKEGNSKNGRNSVSQHGENASNDDVDELLILSGKERNDYLEDTFTGALGGLRPQISSIVRRVLDGRVFRSYDEDDSEGEIVGEQSLLDAKELEALGLNPVRGLLLYGPPGCGKTALAREISKALRARNPKIIAAPELLDRWVGGSEKLVRSLFHDAETELKYCNGDATKSSLHVIVIDEIDAVFRKRTSSEDSGATTRASAVNQILAKLDGVQSLSNVLLIGMTNRRDLLDEALLRPGRLEVQVEIPLPSKEGRREIFQIHYEALRRKGRLSGPLCRAIDGPTRRGVNNESSSNNAIKDDNTEYERKQSLTSNIKTLVGKSLNSISMRRNLIINDLASDRLTKGFSGADIQGLVRCSGSIALSRARQQGMGLEGLLITEDDVLQALEEVKR